MELPPEPEEDKSHSIDQFRIGFVMGKCVSIDATVYCARECFSLPERAAKGDGPTSALLSFVPLRHKKSGVDRLGYRLDTETQ